MQKGDQIFKGKINTNRKMDQRTADVGGHGYGSNLIESISKCIKKAEVVCYEDLGTEAIRKLEVENFPMVVVIDAQGNNLYETAVQAYQ